jgi:alpha-L-fucosidase
MRGLTLQQIHFLFGILLITTPALAQETKSSDAATVKAEHSMIGLGGEKAEHNTHPGAQSYPEAAFGLFLHWDIASVRAMNISWPMIPAVRWR